MKLFDDENKMYVHLEVRSYGKTRSLNAEYDNDTEWCEVVNDLVSLLESQWGYSFNIHKEHEVGIYYPGKNDD